MVGMLILVWMALILVIVLQVLTYNRMERIERDIEVFRVRQGRIAGSRASTAVPKVDSRARTTRRDTPDLPATGRMSTAVHRQRSNGRGLTDDS